MYELLLAILTAIVSIIKCTCTFSIYYIHISSSSKVETKLERFIESIL